MLDTSGEPLLSWLLLPQSIGVCAASLKVALARAAAAAGTHPSTVHPFLINTALTVLASVALIRRWHFGGLAKLNRVVML